MRTLGERYFVKGQIPLPCQELASIAFADWCTPVSAGALRFPGSMLHKMCESFAALTLNWTSNCFLAGAGDVSSLCVY